MAETDKPSLSLRPGGFSSRSGNKDGNATKEGSSKPAQESSTTTETTNASAALSNPESELKDPTKHPLEYPWTMWYPVTKGSSYSTSQIYTFQTVENFWALFNNLEMPSKISDTGKKIDMFFFRSGYKPEWEDPANVGGASLCALFPRPSDRQKVDVGWLNTVLALIGNTFPHMDVVTGVALQLRPKFNDRIQIWLKKCDRELSKEVEKKWLQLLVSHGIPENTEFEFLKHGDTREISAAPQKKSGGGGGGDYAGRREGRFKK